MRKQVFIISVVFFTSCMFAETNIDKLIDAIQKSPLEDRYKRMNELKKVLRSQNETYRKEVLIQLQNTLNKTSYDTNTKSDRISTDKIKGSRDSKIDNNKSKQNDRIEKSKITIEKVNRSSVSIESTIQRDIPRGDDIIDLPNVPDVPDILDRPDISDIPDFSELPDRPDHHDRDDIPDDLRPPRR